MFERSSTMNGGGGKPQDGRMGTTRSKIGQCFSRKFGNYEKKLETMNHELAFVC